MFILWTIFWSFWSVLISRLTDDLSLKKLKSIFIGRSECPKCKKVLKWYQLIPILSFVFQQGKCQTCKNKISAIYPILEIISWWLFLAIFLLFSSLPIWMLSFIIFFNRALLLLLIYDILYYELNIYIWIFTFIASLMYLLISNADTVIYSLVSMLIMWWFFLAIYLFSKRYVKKRWLSDMSEWFGLGDVLLSCLFGLYIPYIVLWIWFNITLIVYFILIFLILSSVIGLLYFVVEYIFTQRKWNIIPFIPAMIVTFWIMIFCFDKIYIIFTL